MTLANNAVVDDGSKQGTKLGPLQNKMQYEKVKGYLAGVCSVVEAEEPDAHRPDYSDSCALQQPLAHV